jgi:hypothetical protein
VASVALGGDMSLFAKLPANGFLTLPAVWRFIAPTQSQLSSQRSQSMHLYGIPQIILFLQTFRIAQHVIFCN